MSTTKLFVDDFRPAPEGWYLARTITEALQVLSFFEVTEVSLDHDIMHSIPHKNDPPSSEDSVSCPENFSAVARYIAIMPSMKRPTRVIVHTSNAAASYEILSILADAGITAERRLYSLDNYK